MVNRDNNIATRAYGLLAHPLFESFIDLIVGRLAARTTTTSSRTTTSSIPRIAIQWRQPHRLSSSVFECFGVGSHAMLRAKDWGATVSPSVRAVGLAGTHTSPQQTKPRLRSDDVLGLASFRHSF